MNRGAVHVRKKFLVAQLSGYRKRHEYFRLFVGLDLDLGVNIPGTVRPVHICLNAIDTQGQDRMSGFTIMRWRKTHDSCVANGRSGYVSHDGNALPIAEAATALCQ